VECDPVVGTVEHCSFGDNGNGKRQAWSLFLTYNWWLQILMLRATPCSVSLHLSFKSTDPWVPSIDDMLGLIKMGWLNVPFLRGFSAHLQF